MKSEEIIKNRIAEIEADDRYKSGLIKPATLFENAPLALIQLVKESTVEALWWVLEDAKEVIRDGDINDRSKEIA